MDTMKRYEMSTEGIKALVDRFYEKVRDDQELGPIFTDVIGNTAAEWKVHLEKMYSFWGVIMLGIGDYVGNPLQKHLEVPPFPENLFNTWLELFAKTADELLEPQAAAQFKNRSQKMSVVLRRGLYASG